MVDINKLKGKIVENGLTIEKLSEKIGVDKATLYRRLKNNGETFLIRELNLISKELKLTPEEVMNIFFSHSVAFNAKQIN